MHRFRASGSFAAYPRSALPLMFNEVDGWSRFIRHKQVRITASHAHSSPSRLVLKRGSAHPPRVGSRFGPSCSPTIPQLGHSPSCSPTILQLGHSPSCSTCFVCFIDDRSSSCLFSASSIVTTARLTSQRTGTSSIGSIDSRLMRV